MMSKFRVWPYLFLSLALFSLTSTPVMAQYNAGTIEEHRAFLKKTEVSGGTLAFIDEGKGEVIMLVHGVPTSSWLYRHIIPILVGKGYRVIVPDLLGYGSSSKLENMSLYHPKKQGQRLAELMGTLGIESWHHVCHDVGGIWTWEMLLNHPQSVKSIVLLNTILFKEGFDPPMTFKEGSYWGRRYSKMYCSKTFGKGMMSATLKHGLDESKLSKSDKKGYWLPMREGAHTAINNFFTGFEYTFAQLPGYQKNLSTLDIPVAIIWGRRDKILIGAKQIPLIKSLMKVSDRDIHWLDNAKHFIQEEEPEEIGRLIDSFLSRSPQQ